MNLIVPAEKASIRTNADGVAYIGQTRVRLETIIIAFRQGDSPEQIVDSFAVLSLADIYAVIAYYLNHRAEVEAYLQAQSEQGESIRQEIEANRPDMLSLRERLIERLKEK